MSSTPSTRVCRYNVRPSGSVTNVDYERRSLAVGYLLALGDAPSCSTLALTKGLTGRTYAFRCSDMRPIATPMHHSLRSTLRPGPHPSRTGEGVRRDSNPRPSLEPQSDVGRYSPSWCIRLFTLFILFSAILTNILVRYVPALLARLQYCEEQDLEDSFGRLGDDQLS